MSTIKLLLSIFRHVPLSVSLLLIQQYTGDATLAAQVNDNTSIHTAKEERRSKSAWWEQLTDWDLKFWRSAD